MALAGCTGEHCDDVLLRLVGMSPECEEALQLLEALLARGASADIKAESTGKMSRDVRDTASASLRAQESLRLQPGAGEGSARRKVGLESPTHRAAAEAEGHDAAESEPFDAKRALERLQSFLCAQIQRADPGPLQQ